MHDLKINRSLLIFTLLVFFSGVLAGGFYLTVQGYDVPWSIQKTALADTAAVSATDALLGADTIEMIVEKAGPAVVKLETTTKVTANQNSPFDDPFFREFFGDSFRAEPRTQISQGLGSGFIISKDGYILTNAHVVAGAEEIKVYLTSSKDPYTAKVVGSDSELDLAVIKIDAGTDLPILKLGDSNSIKVGNWVIAIGNPYGLDHTVTVGVISAKGRPVTIDGNNYKDLIQTDASINPGNSGGPLLNLNGEVIGINTAINASAQGIGFAISSSTVSQVLDQLLMKGKVVRPWLGVYIQPVTDEIAQYYELAKTEGVLISAIQEDSPAEKAGLKRGDIILEYNKKAITTAEELQQAVKDTVIGAKVTLLIHREGATTAVSLTIEEKK